MTTRHFGIFFLLALLFCSLPLPAQQSSSSAAPPEAPQPQQKKSKRVFYIIPAYDAQDLRSDPYHSLTVEQKFNIFVDNTFDVYTLFRAAASAGIGQATGNPHYGQGSRAYAKRFGAALADTSIHDFATSFMMPSLFHQDPRYFRLGPEGGSKGHRVWYAISRVFVTRNDSGRDAPNYSYLLGSLGAVTLSNTYYPKRDQTVDYTLKRFGYNLGFQAGNYFLKEFWAGISKKVFRTK